MTNLFEDIKILYAALRQKKWDEFKRHVSLGDLFTDRWETAAFLGFGSGSSCYDNVLVLGDVTVGKNSWIGPNVILDGRGGLEIGDFVTVCAGTQIYTHDSVEWSTSLGEAPLAVAPTRIGNGVFLGPQVIGEILRRSKAKS